MKTKLYLSLSLLCALFIVAAYIPWVQSRDIPLAALAAPLGLGDYQPDSQSPTPGPMDKFIYLPLVLRNYRPPTPTPTNTPTPTPTNTLTPTPSGITTWEKTFGGSGSDAAFSVWQTTDGGYVVAGYREVAQDNLDLWIMKLDRLGNLVWDKTFGESGRDVACSIQQTSDSGYVVAGRTSSKGAGGDDMWILKLDPNGNLVWDKTIGEDSNDAAFSIQQTSDGDYIVAGMRTWYNNWFRHQTPYFVPSSAFSGFGPSGGGRFNVIKLDSNGNVIWDQRFGWDYNIAYSAQQTSDGGYIAAGVKGLRMVGGSYNSKAYIVKLDSNGNAVWEREVDLTAGYNAYDSAYSIRQTSDGGYIFTEESGGSTTRRYYVIKFDSNGNRTWSRPLTGRVYSIEQTSDGNYIVAGEVLHVSERENIYIAKLGAADGNQMWERTFGGNELDSASSIRQTSDGGYIVAGVTASKGAGHNDAWILKLDGGGRLY